jgi:hypothetical protein
MGMDVYGKNPSSESGKYFRATIWSWPDIHRLMVTACRDLLSEGLLKAMEYNEGAGPDDQATCEEMANRLEVALKSVDDSLIAETGRVELNSIEELASVLRSGEVTNRMQFGYTTRRELLTGWIEFLRHCGGFSVW